MFVRPGGSISGDGQTAVAKAKVKVKLKLKVKVAVDDIPGRHVMFPQRGAAGFPAVKRTDARVKGKLGHFPNVPPPSISANHVVHLREHFQNNSERFRFASLSSGVQRLAPRNRKTKRKVTVTVQQTRFQTTPAPELPNLTTGWPPDVD